jgi:hypothetical protein
MRSEHSIANSLLVRADAAAVWREITQVDLASFRPPFYLGVMGIPRPLRAEIVRPGVGGARIAYLSDGRRFSQEITEWEPPERYAFTFRPDPGFRVAGFLDLRDGPFRMIAGAYRVTPEEDGVRLHLATRYELHGIRGWLAGGTVRFVLHRVQDHLLRGIKANAERCSSGPPNA